MPEITMLADAPGEKPPKGSKRARPKSMLKHVAKLH